MNAVTQYRSIDDVLRRRADEAPDAIAYTFLSGSAGREEHVTYGAIDRRARAIAAALQARWLTGGRALLMFDPGPGFIAALFGCLYAGVLAVPIYSPHRNRGIARVRAIARDCAPAVVLLERDMASRSSLCREEAPELNGAEWLDIDTLPQDAAVHDRRLAPGELAILQYTSGSTASPKGVMLSHANVLHNQARIRAAFEHDSGSIVVGWLPLFHDMGLIGNLLQPLYGGCRCILMSPMYFLQRPIRWLDAISRYRATTSGGPNFAYDLCVDATSPEDRAGLDLSCWTLAFNGAERVRPETLARFTAAFAPSGFRSRAFYPCYGLAEGTLIVTGGRKGDEPVLAASPDDDRTRRYVGSGEALPGHRVRTVDAASGRVLPDGEVGEIWIAGGNVAAGYWNRPPTEADFAATLERDDGSYFRTGDLGFLRDGELFVTGRLKDLVIIRGRNLFPEDLEASVTASDPGLRAYGSAVVSVDVAGREQLCVFVELAGKREQDFAALRAAIDRRLALDHDVVADRVFFLRPQAIPRTSSGKIQRHLCRTMALTGEVPALAVQDG